MKQVNSFQRKRYEKVAKGVYKYISSTTKTGKTLTSKNTYRVLKTSNGKKFEAYFTNKTKAIQFYNSIK